MKKKVLCALLSATMVASMLAGCGGKTDAPAESKAPAAESKVDAPAAPADAADGTVLNIYAWNTEFQERMEGFYPGYEKTGDSTGKIGDITVVYTVVPNDGNKYQENLDNTLLNQENAKANDKVDIFLFEADYALKYVNSDYTMSTADLGIDDAALANQYEYTKTIATDANGALKGLTWQACSAGLIYNREAATAILGSDDPADVQEAVKDWASFNETAKKAQAAGYTMCSVNDTYRTYSNNVSGPWVQDGKVVIDENIKAWAEDSKALVEAGAENTYALWGADDWGKGKYPEGKTFCYFGPAWFINFSLDMDKEGSIASQNGWGFVDGPQAYYWGGTWIAAAVGTDNADLVKEIMTTMTTDADVMKAIATQKADCVNNKAVLADLAGSDEGNLAVLGGQNPYPTLAAGAEGIDMSNISAYDQGCNEEFQNAMKNYFEGKTDYDGAVELFMKAVGEKYPELAQ